MNPQRAARDGLFVAGTDTGVGKTRVTVHLLRALGTLGVPAVGMKPVATGVQGDLTMHDDERCFGDDGAMIAASSSHSLSTEQLRAITPYRFSQPISPHLAATEIGRRIDLAPIAEAYERLCRACPLVIVEGTGGWLAPINDEQTMADVAVRLGLPVLLVVGLRLGCLNHALLTAAAIAQAGLTLAGWVANEIDPSMQALEPNIATLTRRLGVPPAARLPCGGSAAAHQQCLDALARRLAAGAFRTRDGLRPGG